MKIIGAGILLFILSFGLISSVSAENSVNSVNKNNTKDSTLAKALTLAADDSDIDDDFDDDLDDELDDDSDGADDYDDDSDIDDDVNDEEDDNYCVYCEGECDNCDLCLSNEEFYKEFEWKGNSYYIDLDQFNLTDEELTDLFTKRDSLIEEVEDLEARIEAMELSRNNDTLLAIDALYDYINNFRNDTEFNDFLLSLKFNELLLSLKDINITELNSTFNELKLLLESIKTEYPDDDFTEIDYLMDSIETLLNEELESYENLTSELDEKLAELFELFDKYPFLRDHTKYATDFEHIVYCNEDGGEYVGGYKGLGNGSKSFNKVSARLKKVEMKKTGIPYFSLVILILIMLFGFNIKRRF